MAVYTTKNLSMKELKEIPFKLERNLQNLVEKNLSGILGLEFIQSEFVIKDNRFDTLAFDKQSNSFVIIEYKRNKNFSVIDQGMTYLGLLWDNKAEFVLAYQKVFKKNVQKDAIDWSATRVIFISPSFTDFQMSATFKDLPIELLEVKQYVGDIVITTPIKKANTTGAIKTISVNNKTFETVAKEFRVYTEAEHLEKADVETKELYEEFKESLLNLDSQITIEPKKLYIAFKKNSNICDIEIQKKQLKITLNVKNGKLDDPKKLFQDISTQGHWGNGDYRIVISDDKNLEYILSVIKELL